MNSPAIIETIVSQHAEEAAFLWLLRDGAVHEPHYSLEDLAKLDDRVEAHLDGLRIAGEGGWSLCCKNLEIKEPGEVFAAGVLALESRDKDKLEAVYSVVEQAPETAGAMISALGWVKSNNLSGKVSGLLASKEPLWRKIGLAACAIHRVDPGENLIMGLEDESGQVRARAARAAGELGRADIKTRLLSALTDENEAVRLWSAWSAVLLGDRGSAVRYLSDLLLDGGKGLGDGLNVLIRSLDLAKSKLLLGELVRNPATLRLAILGVSSTGDTEYIPWLIKQMEDPQYARVAGEALTTITGVDIAYDDLEGERPDGFEAGPSEDPKDDNVAMDEDEDLPWPDAKLITGWWRGQSQEFQAGRRYLLGKPVTPEHCQWVLVNGKQRQREAAALEIALMQPNTALFETRMVGKLQQKILSTTPA
ncbi:MAG: TIGR02270 family protein [Planctomycetota bacterium]|jgi:uncharacterized protein (TIGR02270 family)